MVVKKIYYLIILSLFLTFIELITFDFCYSQKDSVKGYNDFYFGESINSVIEKLNDKKINFDSLTEMFSDESDVVLFKVINIQMQLS